QCRVRSGRFQCSRTGRRQEEERRLRRVWWRDRVRSKQQCRRRGYTPGRLACRSSGKRPYVHDLDGWRSSYQFPFLLDETGTKENKGWCFEEGRGRGKNRLDQLNAAVGDLAATRAGVGFGLLLVLLRAAWFLILIVGLLAAVGFLDGRIALVGGGVAGRSS